MSSIIKVDTIQDQDGNNIINENANTITIGKSGDTVTVASGATFVGGGIVWQSVQTTGFTAVSGNGYFCDTTSSAFTVTLPASPSAGDQIQLVDYAGTFDTNALTINPNGNKIEGATDNLQLIKERSGVTITYIDSTQGWLASSGINEGTDSFTPVPYSVDFLVVAGGGAGGGNDHGGAGGAGGYRTSTQTVAPGTAITITVGSGGAGGDLGTGYKGNNGSDSSISGSGLTTITSAGGGGGGANQNVSDVDGLDGGSGGGGGGISSGPTSGTGGTGNTPSVSPSQGNNGGNGDYAATNYPTGGGGGAGAVGGNASNAGATAGNGGIGTASSITGSSTYYAGGGGGSCYGTGTHGTGGLGGGGNGNRLTIADAGTANTGGGGGGTSNYPAQPGGAGGSGVVILRMPASAYTGTTTGSPTVIDDGSYKVLKFTGSGSYTG